MKDLVKVSIMGTNYVFPRALVFRLASPIANVLLESLLTAEQMVSCGKAYSTFPSRETPRPHISPFAASGSIVTPQGTNEISRLSSPHSPHDDRIDAQYIIHDLSVAHSVLYSHSSRFVDKQTISHLRALLSSGDIFAPLRTQNNTQDDTLALLSDHAYVPSYSTFAEHSMTNQVFLDSLCHFDLLLFEIPNVENAIISTPTPTIASTPSNSLILYRKRGKQTTELLESILPTNEQTFTCVSFFFFHSAD